MAALPEHCEGVKNDLLSEKVTKRKEGFKRLNQLLDSESLLHALDAATLRIRQTDKGVPIASWPGIATVLVKSIEKEVGAVGRKKGPDSTVSKTFKRFVQTADDERRSGQGRMLGRRAAKLFAHIRDALQWAGLSSALGTDYSSVLRASLLAAPSYCAATPRDTFQGLLNVYMTRLEDGPLDNSEETFRAVSGLLSLLQCFQGDMHPDFQRDMVSFFCGRFTRLHELRDESRISTAFLAALNTFLLACGLDVSSRCMEVHSAVHALLLRCWRSSRDPKLREAMTAYLRIQLTLGGITGSHRDDIGRALEGTLQQSSFRWTDELRGRATTVAANHSQLLQLVCNALAKGIIMQGGRPHREDSSPYCRPAKRQKVNGMVQPEYNPLAESPDTWGPVLALLARRCGPLMDRDTVMQTLKDVSEPLAMMLEPGRPADQSTLWVLRCAAELAAVWPGVMCRTRFNEGQRGTTDVQGHWQAMQGLLVEWLERFSALLEPTEMETAMWDEVNLTLASILAAEVSSSSANVLRELGNAQSARLTAARMCLIQSVYTHGHSSGGWDTATPLEMLRKVFGEADAVPASILSSCVNCLLGVERQDDTLQCVRCCANWWRDDNEDFARQLQTLLRGEEAIAQRRAHTVPTAEPRARVPAGTAQPSELQGHAASLFTQLLARARMGVGQHSDDQLLRLLGACTAVCSCRKALLAAEERTQASWMHPSPLLEALAECIQEVGSLLVTVVDTKGAIGRGLLKALEAFVECLCSMPDMRQIGSPLLGTLRELERLYRDAEQALVAKPSQGQLAAEPGSSAAARAALFDDDLDLRGPEKSKSGRPGSAGTSIRSSVVATCQATCAQLLVVLGTVHAEAAGQALGSMLEACFNPEATNPPEGLTEHIAEGLCKVAAGSGYVPLLRAAADGLEGLLQLQRFHAETYIMILEQLEALLQKCCLLHYTASSHHPQNGSAHLRSEVWEVQQSLVDSLNAAAMVLAKAEQDSSASLKDARPHCAARIALSEAIVAMVITMHIPELQRREDGLLEDCLAHLDDSLQDPCYAARRHAALTVPSLYVGLAGRYAHPSGSRAEVWFTQLVSNRLSLFWGCDGAQVEQMETSVLLAGETAKASEGFEVHTLFLLWGQAARYPAHKQLVAAVLSDVAHHLGYSSLHDHCTYHMVCVLHSWFRNNFTLDELLSVRDVLGPPEASPKAFLDTCTKALVAALVRFKRDSELHEVAAILGLPSTKALLEKCVDIIMGLGFPLSKTGDPKDKKLANEIIHGGLMAELFTDEERSSLFRDRFVSILGQTLLGTVNSSVRAEPPLFHHSEIKRAIEDMPGLLKLEDNIRVLRTALLQGDAIARLILMTHRQLFRARGNRHQCRSLGPLIALLAMLGDLVCTPHALRHTVHILLQHLHVRTPSHHCATLLEGILDSAYSAPEHQETMGALLPSILSGLVAAVEVDASAEASSNADESTESDSPADTSTPLYIQMTAKRRTRASPLVLNLINKLVLRMPHMHQYLQHLEPLPMLPELQAAQAMLNKLHRGVSLAAELEQFVGRAAALPAVLRSRALASMEMGMCLRRHELLVPEGGRCRPEVEQAAWQLVWLSRDLADNALAAFTGKLLALAGPLDEHCIAFTRSPALGLTSRVSGSKRKGDEGTEEKRLDVLQQAPSMHSFLVEALQLLVTFLADEDPTLISNVQAALRHLLNTKPGQLALADLGALQKAEAAVFTPLHPLASPAPATGRGAEEEETWTQQGRSYEQWLCHLGDVLLEHCKDPLLRALQKVARRRPAMMELVMPRLFASLAVEGSSDGCDLSESLAAQVQKHVLAVQSADLRPVRLILGVLNSLRSLHLDAITSATSKASQQTSEGRAADWQQVYWLDLNYLKVARAALRCSAPFTAMLYVEYWCKAKYGRLTMLDVDLLNQGPLSDVDALLLDIYSQIDEPDGMYAAARTQQAASQLALFEHEGAWDKALVSCDLMLPRGPGESHACRPSEQLRLANALQQLGCQHVLETYWEGSTSPRKLGDARLREKQCEIAWRIGRWQDAADLAPPDSPGTPAINSTICKLLKALIVGDKGACASMLDSASAAITQRLAGAATESASSISQAVVQLQMLQLLSEASASRSELTMLPPQGLETRLQLYEPLVTLQKHVARLLGQPDAASQMLLCLATAARKNGRLPIAMNALHELQATLRQEKQREQEGLWVMCRMEEAKLLWAQGQQSMAMRVAWALLGSSGSAAPMEKLQRSRLQSLLGKWLSLNSSESSSTILDLMTEALKNAEEPSSQSHSAGNEVACRAAFRLATYADSLYRAVQEQISSPKWATAVAIIQDKKRQAAALRAQIKQRQRRGEVKTDTQGNITDKTTRLLQGHINNLERPVKADEQEQADLLARERSFRATAMRAYRRCLLTGSAHDLPVIFKLSRMWFSLGGDKDIVSEMAKAACEVPSYKFLPLAYQLASRLSRPGRNKSLDDSGLSATLSGLVERLACDHPHHVVYTLLALKNGNRGRDGKVTGASPGSDALHYNVDLDKVAAAQEVLQRTSARGHLRDLVHQMDKMADAYISLAAAAAPDKAAEMPFPSSLRRSTKLFDKVPVVSVSVPVDPSCKYDDLACFSTFGDTIQFVGGINKPKLVQCFDSAGVRHRQLVKSGNDDLRQDAVMQQLFGLINEVLAHSPATAKRRLRIVTYKVVPFSPAAGLLEWVEDTVPLGRYLIGEDRMSGAHRRYARPGELSFFESYTAMDKGQREGRPRQAFDKVCAKFIPGMHNFFLENFREPGTWFEKRLTYTRATAVNSMAGYLIGLGDRHSQNILVDRKSAEVVHIDLGIAFEQGRFLNTPELVPFRLTRDIVDGMGAAGVEGVMSKCSEETLRVLRANKESLLTILEVFIHDPLYKWQLTSARAQQRQKADTFAQDEVGLEDAAGSREDSITNADAERVLLRVKQKLEGLEGGEGEARSVEGQVQQLLHDAQDPEKLCRMYIGWASWV